MFTRKQAQGITTAILRSLPEDAVVKCNHYRNYPEWWWSTHLHPSAPPPLSKGGTTKVLINAYGRQALGIARCRDDENFCRYEGRALATKRARRALTHAVASGYGAVVVWGEGEGDLAEVPAFSLNA